jgi:hypothetical protein
LNAEASFVELGSRCKVVNCFFVVVKGLLDLSPLDERFGIVWRKL